MWRAYRVLHLPHSELPPLPQQEAVARVHGGEAGERPSVRPARVAEETAFLFSGGSGEPASLTFLFGFFCATSGFFLLRATLGFSLLCATTLFGFLCLTLGVVCLALRLRASHVFFLLATLSGGLPSETVLFISRSPSFFAASSLLLGESIAESALSRDHSRRQSALLLPRQL